MPHFHHKNVCATHNRVVSQCRCPGPKAVKSVPCPGPPRCGAEVTELKGAS